MSYLLFFLSSFVWLLICVKANGTMPTEEAYLILAILSAAEAIGLRVNR